MAATVALPREIKIIVISHEKATQYDIVLLGQSFRILMMLFI